MYRLDFDNCYIDQFIEEVDGKRMSIHENKESIFPLTWKEELTYIKPSKLLLHVYVPVQVVMNFHSSNPSSA